MLHGAAQEKVSSVSWCDNTACMSLTPTGQTTDCPPAFPA